MKRENVVLILLCLLFMPVIVWSIVHLGDLIALLIALVGGTLLGLLMRPLFRGRYPTRPE